MNTLITAVQCTYFQYRVYTLQYSTEQPTFGLFAEISGKFSTPQTLISSHNLQHQVDLFTFASVLWFIVCLQTPFKTNHKRPKICIRVCVCLSIFTCTYIKRKSDITETRFAQHVYGKRTCIVCLGLSLRYSQKITKNY